MVIWKTKSVNSAVAYWVLAGTGMLFIQVMLGGITRLTGSGLSITEWNVFTGAIPPLNSRQWIAEFNKYKQTPQFHLLNADFSLSDFKFIFFWEWFHRLWARLVGVVFIIGFVLLMYRRKLKSEMIMPLLILFFLGMLQAAIGWIMVASGLTGDAIYVEPTKLALHFIFAIGLISYAFWYSLRLLFPVTRFRNSRRIWAFSFGLLVLVFFQLLFGALMAGNKAAAVAPTWPGINGDWIPKNLLGQRPFILNFIGNKITIHFIHRNLAYLILLGISIWTLLLFRSGIIRSQRMRLLMPLVLVIFQILLGILALLSSTGIVANHWVAFDWLALLHQLNGMLLLFSLIYAIYVLRPSMK
ncbi:MAG TPA: COX15/CtaA family protein [Puia sp.]|jgi:cytochrome c oxidase assembly protein subunit 15|nr:COX15/CtaA family protein [Puia sp.]